MSEFKACNSSRMENIESKIDGLHDKLDKITEVQISQAKDIEHHIKRTDALEAIVLPLNENRLQVLGMFKLISYSTAVIGVVTAIYKLIHLLH